MKNLTEGGPGKICSFWEQKIYWIKEKKDEDGLVYPVVEEGNLNSRVRVLQKNHLLSCEQFPVFTEGKSYRKQQQQQQQQQTQQQYFNKETTDTWDSSDDSDVDLSQLIPALHNHHQKVSQRFIKKQQQRESSLEQPLPPNQQKV